MKLEEKLQTKSISDLKAIMDYLKERMDRATRMGKGWEFETLFNMREIVEGSCSGMTMNWVRHSSLD